MIIEDKEYKRNIFGEISKRQIVKIKCDICKKEWESLFEHRKRKKYKKDFCKNCRAKKNGSIRKKDKPSRYVTCNGCNKIFKRYSCQIKKVNYCTKKCYDEQNIKKYKNLFKTFKNNKNELSYLCGLILGDGHLKKYQKYTTKINISFDIKYQGLLNFAIDILNKLEIKHSVEPHTQSNCQRINFSLANNLLNRYGMLWSGNKHKINPKLPKKIVSNINFAAGLINSDGHVIRKGRYESFRFTNTCIAIVKLYEKCLKNNKINFNTYSYQPKIDKRNGAMPKRNYIVVIGKKIDMKNIRKTTLLLK